MVASQLQKEIQPQKITERCVRDRSMEMQIFLRQLRAGAFSSWVTLAKLEETFFWWKVFVKILLLREVCFSAAFWTWDSQVMRWPTKLFVEVQRLISLMSQKNIWKDWIQKFLFWLNASKKVFALLGAELLQLWTGWPRWWGQTNGTGAYLFHVRSFSQLRPASSLKGRRWRLPWISFCSEK